MFWRKTCDAAVKPRPKPRVRFRQGSEDPLEAAVILP